MRKVLLAGVALLGLCGAVYADELDDQIAAAEAAHQAEDGGACFHACKPCDYAPGSGAATEYDAHHKVKLAKKCHWR
jgi:hypothetical protein